VETLLVLLASSGVFQPLPALPLVVDSVPALATAPLGPVERPRLAPLQPAFFGAAAEPQRPRAVEVSEAYHVRLAIHHIASFATLPLFVAEYILGRKLYTSTTTSPSTRQAHQAVATGVAGLFAVNTVTGAWNLWDSRRTPQGSLRRYLHSGLMMLADAGFVATGLTAPDDDGYSTYQARSSARSRHQTIAIASMGTALASYALMIFWKE
jgi:hypothetical protein